MPRPDGPEAATLDFTSALYLGLRHPHAALAAWPALTTGVPAALAEPQEASGVARDLAELVGCGAAALGASTLHLTMDLLGTPSATRGAVLLWDEGVYPVARWAVERAEGRGVSARSFDHFAPSALARAIARAAGRGRRPVVVCDGHCPGCGRPAPLAAYLALARQAGGLLVVDDTQALGLVGAPGGGATGGGGSLRAAALDGAGDVVFIASLAKAFGAPLAALAGGEALVRRFVAESDTRVHSSPPSAAALAAAARALTVNARWGEALRRRLGARVRRFREGLAALGLSSRGGMHPVQTVEADEVEPLALCAALARAGVRTVPLRGRCRGGAAVAFVVTAAHREEEIDRAVQALAVAVSRLRGARAAPVGARGGW